MPHKIKLTYQEAGWFAFELQVFQEDKIMQKFPGRYDIWSKEQKEHKKSKKQEKQE